MASVQILFPSSVLTTSTCPSIKAQCSGVHLSCSAACVSAPFPSSSFTILLWPLNDANERGKHSLVFKKKGELQLDPAEPYSCLLPSRQVAFEGLVVHSASSPTKNLDETVLDILMFAF